MELYFLRHGAAASRVGWTDDDALRPLTDRGREEVGRMATLLARTAPALDAVLTSPYIRAAQTADIVAEHLSLQDKVTSDASITPGFDEARLTKVVGRFAGAKALLVVGHEPDFSTIIGRLTGARIVLKKGGMALVETPGRSLHRATLVWLVQPGLVGGA
ncbi:MAG: phosphohistidine phosphatase SixA [Thermoleophilia bacterium]|jgi:phosphohistidine phosphatase